jgi:hypothetical protein
VSDCIDLVPDQDPGLILSNPRLSKMFFIVGSNTL